MNKTIIKAFITCFQGHTHNLNWDFCCKLVFNLYLDISQNIKNTATVVFTIPYEPSCILLTKMCIPYLIYLEYVCTISHAVSYW